MEQVMEQMEHIMDKQNSPERKQIKAEKRGTAKESVNEDEILELNVGGEVFMVKRSTMLFAPDDSHLNAMFRGHYGSMSRDAQGRIFLDMSPRVFSVILSYLRAVGMDPTRKKKRLRNRTLTIDPAYQAELDSACVFLGLFDQPPPNMLIAINSGVENALLKYIRDEGENSKIDIDITACIQYFYQFSEIEVMAAIDSLTNMGTINLTSDKKIKFAE